MTGQSSSPYLHPCLVQQCVVQHRFRSSTSFSQSASRSVFASAIIVDGFGSVKNACGSFNLLVFGQGQGTRWFCWLKKTRSFTRLFPSQTLHTPFCWNPKANPVA